MTKRSFYKTNKFRTTHNNSSNFNFTKSELAAEDKNFNETNFKNSNYNLYKTGEPFKQNPTLFNFNQSNNLNQQQQINPLLQTFNLNNTNTNKMFNASKFSNTLRERDIIEMKKTNQSKLFTSVKHTFYCPHCEHCNSDMKDEMLEKHMASIQESKNIIEKTFEFILRSDYLKNNDFNLFVTKPKGKAKDNDIEVIIIFYINLIYYFSLCFK